MTKPKPFVYELPGGTEAAEKRGKLLDSLQKLFEGKEPPVSIAALEGLVWATQLIIEGAFAQPTPLGTRALQDELARLSRGAHTAADAIKKMGDQGFLTALAASGSDGDPDSSDIVAHIAYLRRLGTWAATAHDIVHAEGLEVGDDKGGRPADQRLTSVVINLLRVYHEQLRRKPNRTINPSTGIGSGDFDQFLGLALSIIAPAGMHFESRKVDEIVAKHLPVRDFSYFVPPKFSTEE